MGLCCTVFDGVSRHAVVWTPGLNRLAEAQALGAAADALVAVSLAGSLFFSLSPDASREQVLLYLIINMAPFALLAPLIGPAIDRFKMGHRLIATFLFALRALCALALAFTLLDLALYFFALALLVSAKASGVVRQALVPALVDEPDQLVGANSRLARLNVLAGTVGGIVGATVLAVTDSPAATLGIACATFVAAAIATLRLPQVTKSEESAGPSIEYLELHAPTIVASAWAFTIVRGAVGFFVFGLAFALRRESAPAWMYGAAVAAYGVGTFAGSALAPLLRRRSGEDRIMAGSLGALGVVAIFGALGPSRPLVLLVSLVLGATASVGRQAFDALVQATAPGASHGRAFARFETRFQLGWVIGAIGAVAIVIPTAYSLAIVALALVPAALLYMRAVREAHRAHVDDPFDPIELGRRRIEHALEWHRRHLDRLAVTEVAGVVDLARATGVEIDDATVARFAALRDVAVSTWPVDEREVTWAMERAGELVELLGATESERRSTPGSAAPTDDRAAASDQASGGSTDDDVTVHCDERWPTVSTIFDESSTER